MRTVDTIAAIADPTKRVVGNYPYINATAGETDNFINTLRDKMVLAGWTLISSTVSSGHPDHKLDSAQSPWWQDDVIPPASYIGKLRIRIFATSNTIVRLQAMNISESFIQNTALVAQFGTGASNNWRYNINPFQLVIQHPTSNLAYIIASAIHTPKWFQNAGLEEAFIVVNGPSNGFQTGMYASGSNSFYKIKSTSTSLQVDATISGSASNNSVKLLTPTTYTNSNPVNCRMPNPFGDSAFNDVTKRFPFHCPAAVGLALNYLVNVENNQRWFGWFWDAIAMLITPSVKPWIYSFDNGMQFESHTLNNGAAATLPGALLFRIN